jgi:hypothetical protein
LEIDCEIVDYGEETWAEEKGEPQSEGYVTIAEKARGEGAPVTELKLRKDEEGGKESKSYEEADNSRIWPRVGCSAPLSSKLALLYECVQQDLDGFELFEERLWILYSSAGSLKQLPDSWLL